MVKSTTCQHRVTDLQTAQTRQPTLVPCTRARFIITVVWAVYTLSLLSLYRRETSGNRNSKRLSVSGRSFKNPTRCSKSRLLVPTLSWLLHQCRMLAVKLIHMKVLSLEKLPVPFRSQLPMGVHWWPLDVPRVYGLASGTIRSVRCLN